MKNNNIRANRKGRRPIVYIFKYPQFVKLTKITISTIIWQNQQIKCKRRVHEQFQCKVDRLFFVFRIMYKFPLFFFLRVRINNIESKKKNNLPNLDLPVEMARVQRHKVGVC